MVPPFNVWAIGRGIINLPDGQGLNPLLQYWTMAIHPPKAALNPMLFVGFALASIGAALVLYFRPTA